MKFQLKYELVVMDDEGNIIADASASANVSNVQTLVSTIVGAVRGVENVMTKANAFDAARDADKAAFEIYSNLAGTKQ